MDNKYKILDQTKKHLNGLYYIKDQVERAHEPLSDEQEKRSLCDVRICQSNRPVRRSVVFIGHLDSREVLKNSKPVHETTVFHPASPPSNVEQPNEEAGVPIKNQKIVKRIGNKTDKKATRYIGKERL